MNTLIESAVEVIANSGFPVKLEGGNPVKYQNIQHNKIDQVSLVFRIWNNEHFQVELRGRTISSSRVVDYFDRTNSIRNLKSRISRILKAEYENFYNAEKKLQEAVAYKLGMAQLIQDFNDYRNSVNPCHNVIVDEEYIEDQFKVLKCYYRGYEFETKMDAGGEVYIFQSLFNTPQKELSLTQVTGIIDLLEI